MNQETKDKLKARGVSKCYICQRPRSYGNPLAKCTKCGKRACFDHLTGKIEKDGVGDYCDTCLV